MNVERVIRARTGTGYDHDGLRHVSARWPGRTGLDPAKWRPGSEGGAGLLAGGVAGAVAVAQKGLGDPLSMMGGLGGAAGNGAISPPTGSKNCVHNASPKG